MKPPSPGLRPERLTLWLLLLALSTLFLRSVDEGYSYRPDNTNQISPKDLAMAENLSSDHNFRLFVGLHTGSDGAPVYEMYSRFPVGGYALIKLAILPFGNDLPAKILAARMLMLLLFSTAAFLAFLSLARITSHRWIALAATLLAFSSYHMLLYSNVISVEYSVDLFAVMLVFHGMVVFVQEERFRQLLAKTCVALLLGWRVYAFLLPFLVLGLAHEAIRAWKDGTALWPRVRSTAAAVLRSRYMALSVFALLFGATVLGFNFANEYAAFGGETAVTELPSVQSMLRRTGLNQLRPFDSEEWLHFLRQQFSRVRVAFVPFVPTDWRVQLRGWFPSVPFSAPGLSGPELSVYLLLLLMVVVASAAMVCLAWRLLDRRRRMLLATLALSGFFWTLPMRHNAGHPHEALYYVGVPLAFYSLLLLYLHKRWGRSPVVGLAVAALLAFVVSAFHMEHHLRPDARTAELRQAALSEIGIIRETIRGRKVFLVPGSVEPEWSRQSKRNHWKSGSNYAWDYFPAGSIWTPSLGLEVAARAADFIVIRDRVESDALLTPHNEHMFLYDSAGTDDLVEFYRATYQRVVAGEPAARGHFDVYLRDRTLFHVKDPCVGEEVEYTGYLIFVQVVPEDPKDLPRWHRRQGFGNLVLPLQRSGVLFEGKCMAFLPLPDYPISIIRTGQRPRRHRLPEGPRGPKGPRGWEVEILPAG